MSCLPKQPCHDTTFLQFFKVFLQKKAQSFKNFYAKNMQFFKVLAKNLPLYPGVFR